jgi:hypothetical protein
MAGAFQLGSYQASAFQLDTGPVVSYTSQLNFPSRVYLSAGSAYALGLFPGWSFANSSGGYDLAGTTLFAANVARVTSAGLLVEPSATNLQQFTGFSGSWFGTNPVPVVTGAIAAPDGTLTAATITNDTTSSTHTTTSGSSVSHGSGVYQTYSIYLKAGTCRYAYVFNFDTGYASAFDLTLGTVTSSNAVIAGASTQILSCGNGWYRVILSALTQAAGSSFFSFGIVNSGTPTWSGGAPAAWTGAGETLYAWGPQVELTSYATSFISNPSSTTNTRAADIVSLTY